MNNTLKEIVSNNNMAKFEYVNRGKLYYRITVNSTTYQLEIDSLEDEWKNEYIKPEYKAITLMRWIRKGIENGKFIQLN
jgi:hypothetical protein